VKHKGLLVHIVISYMTVGNVFIYPLDFVISIFWIWVILSIDEPIPGPKIGIRVISSQGPSGGACLNKICYVINRLHYTLPGAIHRPQ